MILNISAIYTSDKSIEVKSQILTKAERAKRSALSCLIFLSLAIISIFIPILHFLLVPLFISMTVYFSLKKFSENLKITMQEISCTHCEEFISPQTFWLNKNDKTIKVQCYKCNSSIFFELKNFYKIEN